MQGADHDHGHGHGITSYQNPANLNYSLGNLYQGTDSRQIQGNDLSYPTAQVEAADHLDDEGIEKQLINEGIVWYRNKDQRVLVAMGILTLVFCVAEFVFGIFANSLALMSDAFHMLSDLISLVVGFIAIQLSRKAASKHKSYGWIRAEVIGGLINGVFLVAVCFFIILEAIQRFIEPPEIGDPMIIIIVGCAGLGMNIIGLVMFASHSSMGGHAGHSHGHGGGGHSHGHGHEHKKKDHKHKHEHGHAHGEKHKEVSDGGESQKEEKAGNANLHAVFLHVLGDALGSVGAVGAGVVIKFVHHDWKYYADPLFSILLTLIILKGSIPLVKHCANILMQSVPENVEVDTLRAMLLKLPGIVNIHDLHIWQLSDTKHIATLHIGVDESVDFPSIASVIKNIFHEHGVHNTTIQPEYVTIKGTKNDAVCVMSCDPACKEKLCCTETTPLVSKTQKPNQ